MSILKVNARSFLESCAFTMTNFMEKHIGHLTQTEQHRIEQLLRQQKNFQEIA